MIYKNESSVYFYEAIISKKGEADYEYGGEFIDKEVDSKLRGDLMHIAEYDFDEYGGVFQKKAWDDIQEVPRAKEQIRDNDIINKYGGDFGEKQNSKISGATESLESLALSCSSTSVVGDMYLQADQLWQGAGS